MGGRQDMGALEIFWRGQGGKKLKNKNWCHKK